MNSKQKLKDLFESFIPLASPQELSVLANLFNKLTNDNYYKYYTIKTDNIVPYIKSRITFPPDIRWDSFNEYIETSDAIDIANIVYEDIVDQYNAILEDIIERLNGV